MNWVGLKQAVVVTHRQQTAQKMALNTMGWVGLKQAVVVTHRQQTAQNGVEYHGLGWFEASSGSHPPPANRTKMALNTMGWVGLKQAVVVTHRQQTAQKNGVEYHGLGWFEASISSQPPPGKVLIPQSCKV